MPHPRRAAVLRAVVASVVLTGAVCANARAALAFEVLPRPVPERRSHTAAWVCLAAGAGLVGASFPLADVANRRYDDYRRETDLGAIDSRWRATVRADRVASGSLLAGEVLLATGVWLRFVHPSGGRNVALEMTPARCALSCSF